MHSVFSLSLRPLAALCCLAAAAAYAQKPTSLPRDSGPPPKSSGAEQKIEQIHHEDAGSRIDELRVGGESKKITVQPKGNAPAYELAPESNNRNPASTDRQRDGASGWKVYKF